MASVTKSKPVLLDLYCGAGGAAVGYYAAGFTVIGVDIEPQPNYPFTIIQEDAISYLDFLLSSKGTTYYDAVHASPPCQGYSKLNRLNKKRYPLLISPTRKRLEKLGKPFIIENVPDAPLRDPRLLCGNSFGLKTYRHRLFEVNGFDCAYSLHKKHRAKNAKLGRSPKPGEFIQVIGHFAGMEQAKEAMGIDWMTREELVEAIPPVYTKWIGNQLIQNYSFGP